MPSAGESQEIYVYPRNSEMAHYLPSILYFINLSDILLKAEERGFEDCAICMGSNSISMQKNNHNHQCGRTSNRGQRPILILSCSHIFHHHCIQNFEKFLVNNNVSSINYFIFEVIVLSLFVACLHLICIIHFYFLFF